MNLVVKYAEEYPNLPVAVGDNFHDAKIYPVEIKGLCDDAYCPKCGYEFWETKELDCERCPECGIRVDWQPWHDANDKEDT